MKITLESWAKKHYNPAPTLPTLRAWARSGHIQPAPVKVGRTWYVDSDATYTPAPAAPAGEVVALSGRAAAIFRAAA